ncbi:Aspartate aminotransferase [Chondrus crispus]|uniref:Aspartate aminotransferase n=1 Tax=Chondrus crispus TaxID=2769 RepID=R7QRC2_CHOCR|nr:Aspartate aminotransferase [Chondrus crispus]CDF40699.1 Aspartate aminotransferase [Chondrus crispus]|eukprot:XP_005710993.1 Aspartate aminotransferase [Chondrus crispus]
MRVPDPVPSTSERSKWDVLAAPRDPILAIHQAYQQDPSPLAVNVSVGAYRDAGGNVHEFRAVRDARLSIAASSTYDHAYLPISGLEHLASQSARLIYGDDVFESGRVACLHTVSGSCALRLALSLASRVLGAEEAHVSLPAWPNHVQMVPMEALKLARYRYYDYDRHAVDIDGMLADLGKAKRGDVVLLQACAHNPSGADLKEREWRRVADVVQQRRLVPVFDMAYQELASGDMEEDVCAVRTFVRKGINVIVAQSFSKNLGLYNSRVGTVSVCVADKVPGRDTATNLLSQLSWLVRGMYSSPPAHGALIAAKVMGDDTLRAKWLLEIKEVVGRIGKMRERLRDELERRKVAGHWKHITQTKGMFVLLGLTYSQVERMRVLHHIYLTGNSRINIAGLNENNVAQVAEAIAEVVQNSKTPEQGC